MNKFKFFTKILLKYILILVIYSIVIISVFVSTLFYISKKQSESNINPGYIYQKISDDEPENLSYDNKLLLKRNGIWMLVLNKDGKYLTSYNSPQNVIKDYSPQEIVKFTRWYIKDFPVFTYIHEDKILVFGFPKNSYGKLANNYFQVNITLSLIYISLILLVTIVISIFIIYYLSKKKLLKEITPVIQAILNISENKPIELNNDGELKYIKKALNKTSQQLETNRIERGNWLRGISHDLRTPLTVISGYTKQLEDKVQDKTEIKLITDNVNLMNNILESLNITYIVENKEKLDDIKVIDVMKLLREISADLLNNLDKDFDINIENSTPAKIIGDKNLLDRAFRNIILNSIVHNEMPNIIIKCEKFNFKKIKITILDNGTITKEKIKELNNIYTNNKIHGFGIIIVKKIILLHNGTINFYFNNPGLRTEIILEKSK